MIRKSPNIASVASSVKVYQLLLNAYPTKFQQEYGSQMSQVFQDCCLRAFRQGGRNGMLRLWAITILDFLRSVVEQHLQKGTHMSRSQFIKLSGWTFILGSFVFIMSILADSLAASAISSILLAVGLLGLRTRYGEDAGNFGRNILLMGVIGAVLLYMILVSLWVLYVIQIQALRNPNQNLWILLFGGPAVVLLALTLFGLTTLRSKPMARLNWLPVFAGIWYPVIYFFIFCYIFANNGAYPAQYQTAIDMMILIQFIALCVLGSILITDTPQEITTS